jgi:hypothetical protein
MWREWERRVMRVGYWYGNTEVKSTLGNPRYRWVANITIDLVEDGVMWIILIWLGKWTSGELL